MLKTKHQHIQGSEKSFTSVMHLVWSLLPEAGSLLDAAADRFFHSFHIHVFLLFAPELDYHKLNPLFMAYFTPLILKDPMGTSCDGRGSGQSRNGRVSFFFFFKSLLKKTTILT